MDHNYKSIGILSSIELIVIVCSFMIGTALLICAGCLRSSWKRKKQLAFQKISDEENRIMNTEPAPVLYEKESQSSYNNDGTEVAKDKWAFEQNQVQQGSNNELHSNAPIPSLVELFSDETQRTQQACDEETQTSLYTTKKTPIARADVPSLPFCGAIQRIVDVYFGSTSSRSIPQCPQFCNRLPTIDSGNSFTDSSVNLNPFDPASDKVCLYPSVHHGEI
jgi:hypothetical protein